jgi:hypothetical protein
MQGNITLGINYVLTYGGWSDSVRAHLDKFATRLNGFASQLRDARNKILSHNDLATMVAGATLGAFAEGAGEKYFKDLQEFVNTVHNQVIGGPWRFIDRVRTNDVADFIAKLKLK